MRFVETSDLVQVMGVQRAILDLYRQDIAKYAANKRCAWVNLRIMGRDTSVKLGLEILRKA